jgi:hypothetical protein
LAVASNTTEASSSSIVVSGGRRGGDDERVVVGFRPLRLRHARERDLLQLDLDRIGDLLVQAVADGRQGAQAERAGGADDVLRLAGVADQPLDDGVARNSGEFLLRGGGGHHATLP